MRNQSDSVQGRRTKSLQHHEKIHKDDTKNNPKKRTGQESTEIDDIDTENRFTILQEEDMEADYTAERAPPKQKQTRIPLIILKSKERWTTLSSKFKRQNLNFIKAKKLNDGISFHSETVEDYRKTIHLLDEEKVAFYTYQLTAEKLFRVAICNIPAEINTTDIKNDLEEKRFQINSIIRTTVGKEKRSTPLIHVSIKKTPEASGI
ncbi:hypothetical protein ILUMI_04567 [Ignelater luminosus]|uniref:Uncharacterized protein n=1 Tax=Ignelater luminosus TaxID=2038154 RepID=A0A8K0GEF3_IGNLU|nr:hypothetical protein ILUMI_04567 [Ignelater luminosus]